MMKVLFFQKGPYHNFDLVVKQAMRKNGDVVVLTDDAYLGKLPCETVDYRNYWKGAEEFAKIYQHKSTLVYEFELVCFQRWFAFAEYLEATQYDGPAFTPDSDVMIFSDMQHEWEQYWKGNHFTLSMGTWAGSSFWENRDWLSALCAYTIGIYNSPDSDLAKQIFQHYDNLQSKGLPGGVCDMTLCQWFAKVLSLGTVGETSDVVNGSTIDHNILMDNQGNYKFTMDGTHKNIKFENGLPVCKATGPLGISSVRFNTIHCSRNHALIPEFYAKGESK